LDLETLGSRPILPKITQTLVWRPFCNIRTGAYLSKHKSTE
jgi:hypothetical protein